MEVIVRVQEISKNLTVVRWDAWMYSKEAMKYNKEIKAELDLCLYLQYGSVKIW